MSLKQVCKCNFLEHRAIEDGYAFVFTASGPPIYRSVDEIRRPLGYACLYPDLGLAFSHRSKFATSQDCVTAIEIREVISSLGVPEDIIVEQREYVQKVLSGFDVDPWQVACHAASRVDVPVASLIFSRHNGGIVAVMVAVKPASPERAVRVFQESLPLVNYN